MRQSWSCAVLKVQVNLPFLKKAIYSNYLYLDYIFKGCDSFGDKAALVDPLGKTTLGELFIENNIT
jgi:hypothetical protein